MKLLVKLKCGYSVQHYLLAFDDIMLCTICTETKQPHFNCITFSLTDIIETLSGTISHVNNYSNN